MYRFEQDLHKERREKGEVPTERINKIWRARQKEMFGSSIELGAHYDLWWSYIPHFLHTPFYVYAYAFGELLTLALYSQFEKHPEGFSEKYLALLSAGGTLSPKELFQPFGIDLSGKEFWQGGISVIEELVSTAKALR